MGKKQVMRWADTETTITDEKESIMHHFRKSLYFHESTVWAKRAMIPLSASQWESFTGLEIGDLVGFSSSMTSLQNLRVYRDDHLPIMQKTRTR